MRVCIGLGFEVMNRDRVEVRVGLGLRFEVYRVRVEVR